MGSQVYRFCSLACADHSEFRSLTHILGSLASLASTLDSSQGPNPVSVPFLRTHLLCSKIDENAGLRFVDIVIVLIHLEAYN